MLKDNEPGIDVLSRFAKNKGYKPVYPGVYDPNTYFEGLIPGKGDVCEGCRDEMEYSIYGYESGKSVFKVQFSDTETLVDVINGLHLKIENLSHFAICLTHVHNKKKDKPYFFIFHFDQSKMPKPQP